MRFQNEWLHLKEPLRRPVAFCFKLLFTGVLETFHSMNIMQNCNRLFHYLGCWGMKAPSHWGWSVPLGHDHGCYVPGDQAGDTGWVCQVGGLRREPQAGISDSAACAPPPSTHHLLVQLSLWLWAASCPAFPFSTPHASWSVCNVQLSCLCLSGALLSAVVSLFNNNNGHLHVTWEFINTFTQKSYYWHH